MDEIPIIQEHGGAFIYNEKLTDIAMIDFKQSELYKRIGHMYRSSDDFAPNIFFRSNSLMFVLKDRSNILKKPWQGDELVS